MCYVVIDEVYTIEYVNKYISVCVCVFEFLKIIFGSLGQCIMVFIYACIGR